MRRVKREKGSGIDSPRLPWMKDQVSIIGTGLKPVPSQRDGAWLCGIRWAALKMGPLFWVCLLLGAMIPVNAQAVDFADVSDKVTVSVANERSSLNRRTQVVTSTADVTFRNRSSESIPFPIHAVIQFFGANPSVIQMPGASGGANVLPYNTYYLPLSDGYLFLPGQSLTFKVTFLRNASVRFTFNVVPYAEAPPENQAPVAHAGPDQTLTLPLGADTMQVRLDGTLSSDPDGEISTYTWTGTPDPEDVATPQITLGKGAYVFSLVVIDDQGLSSEPSQVTITVQTLNTGGPPNLTLNPSEFTVTEGETLAFSLSASDPDGERVTLVASPMIPNSRFTTESGLAATGQFEFSPDFTQEGACALSFIARDPWGHTATATARITVLNVNRPPALTAPDVLSVDEGRLLTFEIKAQDPDGEPVTLSASNLPANALFFQATGTLAFTPDFDQAGDYSLTFQASDGQSSQETAVSVVVNDVTGGGGDSDLVLSVDPVENPTLQTRARITGTVNSGGAPSLPRVTSALITGLSPSTGQQGESLTLTITGQSAGDFIAHFEQGTSVADVGDGIFISNMTVVTPTQATLDLTIDADAEPGPRQVKVTSQEEVALAISVFTVVQGKSAVTGVLKDPESGNPIAGVLVTLQGSALTAMTDPEGRFSFTDVPSGDYVVIFNAPNHHLVTARVKSQVGASVDMGIVALPSTVYDPTAPPSRSLHSVMGRGASLLPPLLSKPDLKTLIIDTVLLAGEGNIDVLDDYGNRVNPQEGVTAKMSLTQSGIDAMADRILRGETLSLPRLLAAYSFSFQWGGDGHRLTLSEWIPMIQEIVNQAWADRLNPEFYAPLIIFNTGNTVSPNPPQISELTRFNPLQAFLFSSSLMACMEDMTP